MTVNIEHMDLMHGNAVVESGDSVTIDHYSEVLVLCDDLHIKSGSVAQVMDVPVLLFASPIATSTRIKNNFSVVNFRSYLKSDIGVLFCVMSHFITGVQIDLELVAVVRDVSVHLDDGSRTHAFGNVTPVGNRRTVDYMHIKLN